MTGIAEMFAELASAQRDHYEMQLELWAWYRRTAESGRVKQWRAANAEHVRAYDRARAGRARPPKRDATQCRSCTAQREPGKASCAKHLAASRERARRAA